MTTQPTPPEGYRLMNQDEKPDGMKGDLCFGIYSGWTTTAQTGKQTVTRLILFGEFITAYARKIH